jgi:hypothetical protein
MVKLSLVTKENAMQTYGGMEVQLYVFFTLALEGGGSASCPATLPSENNRGPNWTGS